MSEQQVWPSQALTDDVLADVATMRAYLVGKAHTMHGDDMKPAQAALVEAVGRLDEFAVSLQARLGVPSALREPVGSYPVVPEPGQVTADVLRRMRQNAGKNAGPRHRAQP